MPMTMDLDIPVETKLELLFSASAELEDCELQFMYYGENGMQPSHVADYEHWKKTNKRSKRR